MAKGLIKNSRSHLLLKGLAIGAGVVVISLINPVGVARALPKFLQWYVQKRGFEKDKLLRDLSVLQVRNLVNCRDLDNGDVEITITERGREKVLQFNIDDMQLKKLGKWDKKWRLVAFDIPHVLKPQRDAMRRKLVRMNFFPLQKSLYLTPYPCEEEVDFVASFYNIRKFVLILYGSHFEGEEKFIHHFQL